MKAGDVITRSDLIQKGFHQVDWFAGYMVFKKFNQGSEDYTYIFHDHRKNKIINILTSDQ